MAIAVEWVAVRMRDGVRGNGGRGIVVIADEVVAHRNLGAREGHRRAVGIGGRQRGVVGQAVRVVGRVARAAEVGVVVVDAGVDDGDLDARTGVAGRSPGLGRAYVRHALSERRLVDRDQVDAGHARHRRERRQIGGLHVDVDAVVRILHLADDDAAGLADGIDDRLLVGLDLRPPGVALGSRHGRAIVLGITNLAGDGLIGQLDHDVHDAAGVDERRQQLGIDLAHVDPLEPGGLRAPGNRCGWGQRPDYEGRDGQGGECATSHPTPPVEFLREGVAPSRRPAPTADVLPSGQEPARLDARKRPYIAGCAGQRGSRRSPEAV